MNVLITGTRHPISLNDSKVIRAALSKNIPAGGHLLIHGDAPGVDSWIAAEVGAIGRWEICAHPADWAQYGKAAGPIRNQYMLDHHDGLIDLVLGFPAPDSRGTWDMLTRAVKAHLAVRVYPL